MIRTLALAALVAAGFSAQAAEDAAIKPDLEKAKSIAESVCVACHGADGNSPTPANPILAGQSADYLFKQLKERTERSSSSMVISKTFSLELSSFSTSTSDVYSLSERSMNSLR